MPNDLATVAPLDCIADELARVQCNLRILTELLGYEEHRFEDFVFKVATRSLELSEGLDADEAEQSLEERVRNAHYRIDALLNQCDFDAIRALDQRLIRLIAESGN